MAKKFRLVQVSLCLLAIGVLSVPARADIIQIGTLSVSQSSGGFFFDIHNLMSDVTMTATDFSINGGSPSGLASVAIAPGQTETVLIEAGVTTANFSFSGNLSNLDFTVGGTEYQAASLNWS